MTDSIYSTGAGYLIRTTAAPLVGVDFSYRLAFKITANPSSGDVDVISHLHGGFGVSGANVMYLGCFGSGIFGSRQLRFHVRDSANISDVNNVIGDSDDFLDEWLLCAYTRNGTTGDTHFYIARKSDPTTYLMSHSVGLTSVPGGNPQFALLRAIDDAITNPRALVAGLAVYAEELSEAEVQAEWLARAPTHASPTIYLPLSVVTGTGQADAGLDASGNGRDYAVTQTLATLADEPWAAAAAPSPSPLAINQRARGFPRAAKLPGIARLGFGLWAVTTQPPAGSAGVSNSAVSSFASAATGTLTFSAAGSSAASSFASDATAATQRNVTDAPWAQAQPMVRGFPRASRLPAPPPPRLGFGTLRADATAAVSITGTATAVCSPFASSAAGLLTFAATGSSAASPFASAVTGLETFTGTASAAASPFASAATGLETFTGTGSAAASPFASAATGAETFIGTGSATCSPFASSGAAAVGSVFTATGSSAVSPFVSSGAGLETFTATGSTACSPLASSGLAAESFTGSASAACSPFGSSGNAAVGTAFTGSGSSACSPFASSASGTETYSGTGSSALSSAASSGSVLETFSGSGSAAASRLASAGTAVESFAGTGSAAAIPFGSAGNAAVGTVFVGSGASSLSAVVSIATAFETFIGSAAAALSPLASTSSGTLAFLGSGTVALSPFASLSVGMVGDFIGVGVSSLAAFGSWGSAAGGTVFIPLPTLGTSASSRVASYSSTRAGRVAKYQRRQ